MSSTLNLFPARVPIGQVTLPDGTELKALASMEFLKALKVLFERVGGTSGPGNGDLSELIIQLLMTEAPMPAASDYVEPAVDYGAVVAELAALRQQVDQLAQQVATPNQAPSYSDFLQAYAEPQIGIDWERPGMIGARAANTGAFTTLTASGAVALSPASANVVMSPTGTGVVTINPATLGTMDKMTIGATTAAAGTFTTVNKITFTQPAVSATFTLATGKTFTVSNTLTLTGTDGSTLAIGGGGTLGSAAYTSSGTYALLAGSIGQAFSTSALTNAGNLTVGSANGSDYIIKPGDGTNTGKLMIQPGGGSGGYGASLVLYSHSHATHPGDIVNSISLLSGGSFRITSSGLDNGTTVFTVAGATGDTTILGGFGCNTKAAQTAAASGGALAAYGAGANGLDTGANMSALHALVVAIRAALVANGIMS